MTFDEIVESGQLMGFYGVDGSCFKLGPFVFEAVEDEDDGYRSMMREVRLVPKEEARKLNFFRSHLENVSIRAVGALIDFDGWEIVGQDRDEGPHVWLRFGTDHADHYYPYFVFTYTPRPPPGWKEGR